MPSKFIYFECKECEWDFVGTEKDARVRQFCPACLTDTMHVNELTFRPARRKDKVEGPDART